MKTRIIVALVACILFVPGLLMAEQIEIGGIKGEMRTLVNGVTLFIPDGWEVVSEDWDGWKEYKGADYDPMYTLLDYYVDDNIQAKIKIQPMPEPQIYSFGYYMTLVNFSDKWLNFFWQGYLNVARSNFRILDSHAEYKMTNNTFIVIISIKGDMLDPTFEPDFHEIEFYEKSACFYTKHCMFMFVARCPDSATNNLDHLFDVMIESVKLPNNS